MKTLHVGIENGDENRAVAWVINHPGCFAYGADPESALSVTPAAIADYRTWLHAHGCNWIEPGDIDLCLDETWQVYSVNENYDVADQGYAVNAWFRSDWKPLSAEEVEHGLKILSWSREDLFNTISNLDDEILH